MSKYVGCIIFTRYDKCDLCYKLFIHDAYDLKNKKRCPECLAAEVLSKFNNKIVFFMSPSNFRIHVDLEKDEVYMIFQ